MKKIKNMNKTTRIALQRFLELTIPAVLLSLLYSLLLQWGIIKTVMPGGRNAFLMYYTPMLFAMIYAAGNAIRMRQSRKLFITISGSHSETDENGKPEKGDREKNKLIDDPKGYYIANYSALAAFAILPFISRYAFDAIVFRWIFGITNWLRIAVTGLGYRHLNDVPVHTSIAVFVLILAALIPLAQINVRKNYIKNIEKNQMARKERLSTATKTTKEHREIESDSKTVNIYDSEKFEKAGDNREWLASEERRKMEEASRQYRESQKESTPVDIYNVKLYDDTSAEDAEAAKKLREQSKAEKLDIYSMAARKKRELSDEEKAQAEESRRLRENGRAERLDIYSMAVRKERELSEKEKAREEESRRLREKGKQGPQRVDIYNMKKE